MLINITGGSDMTLYEVDEAANRIREEVDDESNIIFGSAFNQELEGKIRVSVVATGIAQEGVQPVPNVKATEVDNDTHGEEITDSKISQDDDIELEGAVAQDEQREDIAFINNNQNENMQNASDFLEGLDGEDQDEHRSEDAKGEKEDKEVAVDETKTKEGFFEIPAFLRKRLGK